MRQDGSWRCHQDLFKTGVSLQRALSLFFGCSPVRSQHQRLTLSLVRPFVGEAEFLVARNLVAVCVLEASLQKI